MGFFEGFRSALNEENSVEFFCREYQQFALGQPDHVIVTFFQGFRAACSLSASEARDWKEDEGGMFSRFSGEELSSVTKLSILARAIYQIEKQDAAIPRPSGHALNLPYFQWDEEKEAGAVKVAHEEFLNEVERNPALRRQLDEMGFFEEKTT